MKITELIVKLAQRIETVGDVEVFFQDPTGYETKIGVVAIHRAEHDGDGEDRIVLTRKNEY